jgi:hypothetical protein
MIPIEIQTFDQYGKKSHRICFKINEKDIKRVVSICKNTMKEHRNRQFEHRYLYIFGVPSPQFPDIIIMFNGKEIKTKWRKYNKNDLFWLEDFKNSTDIKF